MLEFVPAEASYRFDQTIDDKMVLSPITDIRPILRNEGVECINPERGASILDAIKSGSPLPPIWVNIPQDLEPSFRFSLYDGYHRFNISIALRFTHIPVVVKRCFDLDALY